MTTAVLSYAEATAKRDELEQAVKLASVAVKAVSGGGAFNKTPDAVRASDEYRQRRAAYAHAFQMLQRFNVWYVARFELEIRAARRAGESSWLAR